MSFNVNYEYRRGTVVLCTLIVLFIYGRAFLQERDGEKIVTQLNEEYETRIVSDSLTISPFDPNTVELSKLLSFGLSKYEALSIIRYRAAGKVFHIKEEVIGCYAISDSLYFALEPYITIGDEFKYKQKEYTRTYGSSEKRTYKSYTEKPEIAISEFLADTVGVKYLHAIGALSIRQAEVFVKWRDMSGIHSMDELRECYTVSDECALKLEPYIIFTPRNVVETKQKELVNLNKADTTELVSIYGIGSKSANAIVEYRKKLGGFYSAEQLSEINIITESNYEKIIQQILVDSCDISKIDVNFAPAKELSTHPYIDGKQLRKLLKQRVLKGGWRKLEEMIEDDIFTEEEAQRVRPYLQFSDLGEFSNRR